MNNVSCPALMVSAMASGQGKTTVTAALALAHRRLGRRVQVFKVGPDFIDPMVLERASGQPVLNIDDRMVGVEESTQLLSAASVRNDLLLVEGAMGLFDGPPSSSDLACALGLPVLLVINAKSMAQTFGAIVRGLAGEAERRGVRVYGAIANQVASSSHAAMLASSMGKSSVMLATLPRTSAALPERHLGLVSEDVAAIDAAVGAMADALASQPDTLTLPPPVTFEGASQSEVEPLLQGHHIAIARDSAFRFIYPANISMLERMGAHLSFFSPLADEAPRSDAHAVWLPGGYPELHAQTLSTASNWMAGLREHLQAGKAIFAECGGLMSLSEVLVTQDKQEYRLAGLLRGRAVMCERPQGLGVQVLTGLSRVGKEGPSRPLRGHTFHYATFETPVDPVLRCNRLDGKPGEHVWRLGPLTASFFHAYFPSSPDSTAVLFHPKLRDAVCHC